MAKRIKPILGLAGALVAGGLMLAAAGTANATIVGYTGCTGANSCDVTTTPPDPVTQDPNDGILLGWNEVQNTTLTADLRVDRSHYFQWDPGNGSAGTVEATINLDSQVFAFITDTQKLFDSDAALGLSALDYNDFGLRGLESGDTTNFNGENVDIDWTASSPGDWTRLITAFSPAAAIPEPGALAPFGLGLAAFAGLRIARRKRAA